MDRGQTRENMTPPLPPFPSLLSHQQSGACKGRKRPTFTKGGHVPGLNPEYLWGLPGKSATGGGGSSVQGKHVEEKVRRGDGKEERKERTLGGGAAGCVRGVRLRLASEGLGG